MALFDDKKTITLGYLITDRNFQLAITLSKEYLHLGINIIWLPISQWEFHVM